MSKFNDRLATLKRRRDFLESRIADYKGKNNSRDRAEWFALRWAIALIEAHPELALALIYNEVKDQPRQVER